MNILDRIIQTKHAEVAAAKAARPPAELRARALAAPPPRDFAAALRPPANHPLPRIIAELKKASPSKGLIRAHFAPAELAAELAAAGAAALSVLTDQEYFQGSLDNLSLARTAVDLPLLRKDFIVDPYQIDEARAHGADAILLIAAALDPRQFEALLETALALGLGVLAEVHDQAELDWVLATRAPIIGVNSRDLKTFRVDVELTRQLLGRIPPERLRVAESGIQTAADLAALRAAGADAALIGESLMRSPHPGLALRQLLELASPPVSRSEA